MVADNTGGATLHLDSGSFEAALKDAGDKPVLVDFFAEWCGPCRMAAPIIDELADEYQGKAVVAKVDVDNNQDLAQRFGVMSIPTVIMFKSGEEVGKQIGFIGREGYEAMIKEHLAE